MSGACSLFQLLVGILGVEIHCLTHNYGLAKGFLVAGVLHILLLLGHGQALHCSTDHITTLTGTKVAISLGAAELTMYWLSGVCKLNARL